MFEFCEISKSFRNDFWDPKVKVLDQISFEVRSGVLCGFLGVNGAGKTTSLKILLSFIKPDSGQVKFSSEIGVDRKSIFSKIGYMPERPYFYPDLTGNEFLEYMGILSKISKNDCKLQIKKWTEEINIAYALKRKIRTYSKGMLQRLGFAATLLHEPSLIILDEPMAGLDPIGRKEFKNIFKSLHLSGKTVFFSSHIVNDIEEICEDVVVIDSGKLFYSGSMTQLFDKYSNDQYIVYYEDDKVSKIINLFSSRYEESLRFIQTEIIGKNKKLISFERKNTSLEDIVYRVEK